MAISVEAAIEIISNLTLDLNYEIIPIENATNRICAQEIFATSFLPKFNNSAMDGYAIIYQDRNSELNIIDTIFAGDNNGKLLEKDSCIKIIGVGFQRYFPEVQSLHEITPSVTSYPVIDVDCLCQ